MRRKTPTKPNTNAVEVREFRCEGLGSIRTVQQNGEILYCGTDIARALGYKNSCSALRQHCKGDAKYPILTAGGIQELSFVTEADAYRLIARSEMAAAKQFDDIVFGNALPFSRLVTPFYADSAARTAVE